MQQRDPVTPGTAPKAADAVSPRRLFPRKGTFVHEILKNMWYNTRDRKTDHHGGKRMYRMGTNQKKTPEGEPIPAGTRAESSLPPVLLPGIHDALVRGAPRTPQAALVSRQQRPKAAAQLARPMGVLRQCSQIALGLCCLTREPASCGGWPVGDGGRPGGLPYRRLTCALRRPERGAARREVEGPHDGLQLDLYEGMSEALFPPRSAAVSSCMDFHASCRFASTARTSGSSLSAGGVQGISPSARTTSPILP